jgi:RNA polymerase sigma-70 factor (ECF subfamily)
MLADSSPVQRGRGGVEWSRESTSLGGTLVRVRFPSPAEPGMSGSLKEVSASDLALRIQDGNPDAEAELVARFSEGISFLLRRWTRDHTVAEDLFQETFRLALEKIRKGEVRDPDRLAGFLRSLAKNLSIEHYRRGARRDVREDELEAAAELSAPEAGQLGQLLRQEKAALVRQVLEELGSERDRQVLFRFYISEDDKEQIRSDLGLTGPEFNLVLFRARRRYRDLYERHAAKGRE